MVDDETKRPAEVNATTSRRAPYEKPALVHLGSVNQLTLAISHANATDGTKTKPKGQG